MSVAVIECFCMWSDLLGFGDPFQEANWTFSDERALENIERLRDLSNCLYTSAAPLREVALVLNDGLARIYDVQGNAEDAQMFLWWVHSILTNHWQVNAIDRERGRPGLRSLLTFGERVATWKGATTLHEMMQFGGPKPRLENRTCIYSPDEFQLNLAFSKAYTIESIGSKGGLTGPALFIDETALQAVTRVLTDRPINSATVSHAPKVSSCPDPPLGDTAVTFQIVRKTIGNVSLFEVYRAKSGVPEPEALLALELDSSPIHINKRGIVTDVWKVRRYQPIDEPRPFYFDFNDYRFAKSNHVSDVT
ncbi:hypothetical protein GCM10008101_27730 [Lysobacter xinjiangensis]|uniref:Uncharacterized protein n=1 Tax=Cognatilysobacter xinjiangensis TaxID=546892 RepID=A0ABQ3C7G1_9GAMM|nr:hypothetical protein [Lysobacter xinjiangensis]GGZ71948.1 hypothetical protein GCM10008101_27730 [Lysobacter xinjiangensis]